MSILNDLPLLAGRFLMATGLSTLVIVATHYTQGQAPILDWLGAFVALVAVRAIGYAFIRYMRSRRLIEKATLIVGCGMVGTGIAHALMRERSCGLEPIGFVDSPPPGMATDLPLPLLGPLPKLPELMAEYNVEYVLVAYTHQPESDLVGIIRSADRLPGGVAVVPRLFELTSVRGGTDVVSDIPLVRLRRPAFRSPFWPLKRAGDAVVAGLAIVLLSPLLLLIAALDRIVDGPGVIFRQERVGIDGRTIEVLKFRSLRPADPGESETKWNISNDNRVSWLANCCGRARWTSCRNCSTSCGETCRSSARARNVRTSWSNSGCCTRTTAAGTGCRAASPDGRRSMACAEIPPSPHEPATTTSTSKTGRSG